MGPGAGPEKAGRRVFRKLALHLAAWRRRLPPEHPPARLGIGHGCHGNSRRRRRRIEGRGRGPRRAGAELHCAGVASRLLGAALRPAKVAAVRFRSLGIATGTESPPLCLQPRGCHLSLPKVRGYPRFPSLPAEGPPAERLRWCPDPCNPPPFGGEQKSFPAGEGKRERGQPCRTRK